MVTLHLMLQSGLLADRHSVHHSCILQQQYHSKVNKKKKITKQNLRAVIKGQFTDNNYIMSAVLWSKQTLITLSEPPNSIPLAATSVPIGLS